MVAWLEALAGQALDDEAALSAAGGGTAGRFGSREGVWAETRLRLAAGVARSGDQPLVGLLPWLIRVHRVHFTRRFEIRAGDALWLAMSACPPRRPS